MFYITNFADAAVVLPLMLAVWAVGVWQRCVSIVSLWVACVGAVWLAVLCLKVVCLVTSASHTIGISSPSGHTASACVVYGGIAWLLGHRRAPILVWMTVFALTMTVGMSRIVVGAHNAAEVALGAIIGACGLAVLHLTGDTSPDMRPRPVIVAAVLVIALLHGTTLPIEKVMQRIVRTW